MTYRGITRRGGGGDSWLGGNNKSWGLHCDGDSYYARYNGSVTVIRLQSSGSTRVGVCVDRPAGTLSFYRVSPGGGRSSDTLTHIHTFQLTPSQEDLLPGFGVYGSGSSCLCVSCSNTHSHTVYTVDTHTHTHTTNTHMNTYSI